MSNRLTAYSCPRPDHGSRASQERSSTVQAEPRNKPVMIALRVLIAAVTAPTTTGMTQSSRPPRAR
ncbi:hypothetical protein ACX80O_16110 [Arthrobacter sp. Hz1]